MVANRLNSGNFFAFGIIEDGILIYSTWISKDLITFPSHFKYKIPLEENQCVLEDSYCHPNFRGKGIHFKMNLFRLMKICLMEGKNEVTAIVTRINRPALKTQKKCGLKIVSKISILKIFGKEFIFKNKFNETDL